MKFTVDKQQLEKAIMTALGAVASKASIPSLEGLLLSVEGNTLTLTGYDLEIGITSTLPCKSEENGKVVLPAGRFADIVRALPSDKVIITVTPDFHTQIVSGPVVFNIIGTDAGEYPELPKPEYKNSISLSQKSLQSMIRQTVFAVSVMETKPIFTGCLFETEGQDLIMVGLDGYRLALRREPANCSSSAPLKCVVPAKALNRLVRLLDDSDNTVVIHLADRNILFQVENNTLCARLLDGEFLNYRKTLQIEKTMEIVADVKPFVDSVRRASLIVYERQRSPIKLRFNDDVLSLECVSPIGKVEDCFKINSNGGDLTIGFNNKFLLDAFTNAHEEQVKIEMKGALDPMVIRPIEGNRFVFLVLPVKLKDANEKGNH